MSTETVSLDTKYEQLVFDNLCPGTTSAFSINSKGVETIGLKMLDSIQNRSSEKLFEDTMVLCGFLQENNGTEAADVLFALLLGLSIEFGAAGIDVTAELAKNEASQKKFSKFADSKESNAAPKVGHENKGTSLLGSLKKVKDF